MTEEQNLDPSVEDVKADEAVGSSGDASAAEEGQAAGEAVEGDQAAQSMDAFPQDDAAGNFEKRVNENDVPEDEAEAAMLSMLEELPAEEQNVSPDDINFGSASVSKAEFQQLSQPAGNSEPRNIELLMDVDLPVSIELGRTKMSISDILSLGPGSVVELNKLAGEPVDLLVNQKVVAKGEVVVVDENFGLRITQLLTQEERLKSLGKE